MGEPTPRPVNLSEIGMDTNGNFIMGQPSVPSVLRDEGGRVVWKLQGNSPEENEQLGIRNVQGLFLEKFPEFDEMFPRLEDGKIEKDRREEARNYISKIFYRQKIFNRYFPNLNSRKRFPFFEGSYKVILRKSFGPWGIEFSDQDFPRKPSGYWTSESIASNALIVYQKFGYLTHPLLQEIGNTDLMYGLSKYPGGMKALLKKVKVLYSASKTKNGLITTEEDSLPKTRTGKILWRVLVEKTPDSLIAIIEKEARRILSNGVELTDNGLRSKGYSSFTAGVQKYYPGGLTSLQESLGLPILQKPRGYWKDPNIIEQEAISFLESGDNLTQQGIKEADKSSLWMAIAKYYPGGIFALRSKLSLESSQRPKRYWTPEQIERETRDFINQEGKFSYTLLQEKGRMDLVGAISKNYHGGIYGLRKALGLNLLRKSNDHWTKEQIEKDSALIIETQGSISFELLIRQGKYDLVNAIRRHYPGGITGLKEQFGLKLPSKPEEYPTPEKNGEKYRVILDEIEIKNLLESLTNEQKYEINRKFWEFIRENPDSEISIVDFAVDYLRQRGAVT